MPRFFSWIVPFTLAGMSTPRNENDIIGLQSLGFQFDNYFDQGKLHYHPVGLLIAGCPIFLFPFRTTIHRHLNKWIWFSLRIEKMNFMAKKQTSVFSALRWWERACWDIASLLFGQIRHCTSPQIMSTMLQCPIENKGLGQSWKLRFRKLRQFKPTVYECVRSYKNH